MFGYKTCAGLCFYHLNTPSYNIPPEAFSQKICFFILWGHQTHQPVIGLAHMSQPLKILLGLHFPIRKG